MKKKLKDERGKYGSKRRRIKGKKGREDCALKLADRENREKRRREKRKM